MDLSKFIKEHAVTAYYVVTLLISWGGLVIMLGGMDQISPYRVNASFLPLYLVTVAGPIIAGILLTGLYDGINGYREFLSRLIKWRVETKWYVAALFIAPLTVFTTLFALSLFSPVFQPGILSSANNPIASSFGISGASKIELFLFVALLGFFNGLVEEFGWTGFVAPRLKSNHGLITGGALSLGFMWGLWHFLSNYLGSANEAGTLTLPLYLAIILFSFLPPFRVIMLWVYEHTKSLLIAIIMHASLDVFWILSMPLVLTGRERTVWYLTWAALLWGIVVVISKAGKRSKV
ncbi:MAG: CPBP family intramembrane metalloprotease [Bacteroidetes bacterium]|nr:CPBP family intramembrane metalloprotease [Bacteroidota bacterium]